MDIEAFKAVLGDQGIRSKESGKSLVVQYCPECGDNLFKVHFNIQTINQRQRDDKDPLLGRCFRGSCEAGYSSRTYLVALEIDAGTIDNIHAEYNLSDADIEEWTSIFDPTRKPIEVPIPAAVEPLVPEVSLEGFLPFTAWPDHRASLYGVGRGVVPVAHPDIMIDPQTSSVVFVVRDQAGRAIGWQKRFVKPNNPKMKTQTSKGFEKTNHILRFKNPGRPLLICEGPFTALSAWHYGYDGIATFGSGVSERQLKQIANLVKTSGYVSVGVAFDQDEAGAKGLDRIRRYMSRMGWKTFLVGAVGFNDLNDAWQAGAGVVATEPTMEQWILDPLEYEL